MLSGNGGNEKVDCNGIGNGNGNGNGIDNGSGNGNDKETGWKYRHKWKS